MALTQNSLKSVKQKKKKKKLKKGEKKEKNRETGKILSEVESALNYYLIFWFGFGL